MHQCLKILWPSGPSYLYAILQNSTCVLLTLLYPNFILTLSFSCPVLSCPNLPTLVMSCYQVMHQCLKIFWSATMYSLPEVSRLPIVTHCLIAILPNFITC